VMHEPIQFTAKKDELILECVMAYHSWSENHLWCFINNGRAVDGGTHERGLIDGIKKLKKKLDLPEQVDNGLILVASIRYPNAVWEGCIKSIISNPELKPMVSSLMVSETVQWLKGHPDVYGQIRQLQRFQFPEAWYR
jgi:DNA gyrase/topoisomerase IV subunit B